MTTALMTLDQAVAAARLPIKVLAIQSPCKSIILFEVSKPKMWGKFRYHPDVESATAAYTALRDSMLAERGLLCDVTT